METLGETIVLGLAVWQIVEIWHHGSIFAGRRADLEIEDSFKASLLSCPFCLSTWVGWFVAAMIALAGLTAWLGFLKILVAGLAAARLANLGNDLFHDRCRTPRPDNEEYHDAE